MNDQFQNFGSGELNQSRNFSQIIASAHTRLIKLEVIAVFVISLLMTSLRFRQGIVDSLTKYPGSPKVFFLPIICYYTIYKTHAWDRSVIIFSNNYYVRLLKSSLLALVYFGAFAFLLKYPISRIWVLLNALSITLGLLVIRYLIRVIYLKRFKNFEELNYLYVGSKSKIETIKEGYTANYGFTPRILHLDPPKKDKLDDWFALYERTVIETRVYGVIIGIGEIQDTSILRLIADSNRKQVIDLIIQTKIGAISNRFEQLESASLVRVQESTLTTSGAVLKRIFDVIFALVVLILFTPVFILTSIAIKISSEGPILYLDKRVGQYGRLFIFPKFRSMVKDADKQRLEVLGRPDEEMATRYKSDPRITKVGRFIRRWSIDELPQFWCVLIGTMSVVGPRPILQQELVQIPFNSQVRFMAKPGLTGLWQVTGRKEVPWEDRMIRDITYIDNWSLLNDLFLVWKTIGVIINGHGAH